MTIQQFFDDHVIWWLNPKYPMGRWDYFWTSVGVGLLCGLLYFAVTFFLGFSYGLEAGITGREITVEDIPTWIYTTSHAVCTLPLLPLDFRRCKAACIPYFMIWIALAFTLIDNFAAPDTTATPLLLTSVLIHIWILFAPNKVEPVTANPNQ